MGRCGYNEAAGNHYGNRNNYDEEEEQEELAEEENEQEMEMEETSDARKRKPPPRHSPLLCVAVEMEADVCLTTGVNPFAKEATSPVKLSPAPSE